MGRSSGKGADWRSLRRGKGTECIRRSKQTFSFICNRGREGRRRRRSIEMEGRGRKRKRKERGRDRNCGEEYMMKR